MSGMHLSKEFFELLKAIGEARSKQEEDRIIVKEVATLKKKLETPVSKKPVQNALATNRKKAKEFLVRLLYVEMLGHDGSFGYIKAVELAASSSIIHKRTGYLVCSACLAPEHEFRFMLVNQMQRDLQSTNVLETCGSLSAVTKIITSDMVPAISGEVTKLLEHSSETVRKRAIVALHRFHQIAPEVVSKEEMVEKVRRSLCDRDPSVMGSTLNVIQALCMADSLPFKDLVPSLVSILKQVCEHRLPSDFDYHRVPAPWIQMKIVRILSILGAGDANSSNGMYEILADCMKRADVGINAGYAIIYECVRCITRIYPNPVLLDQAAEGISRFLSSRSQNLRYLGVTGLAAIVEGHPKYAAQHQLAVIECLEDTDETLQRKTLDLLYRMTNPVNVEFITDRLLTFLKDTTDPYLRQDLTLKICNIAERYAPSNAWYVKTATNLFGIAGEVVRPDVAQNLMSLIAEGTGDEESEEADIELRRDAVEIYAALLDRPPAKIPKVLAETMAWVLGEYAYLSTTFSLEVILEKMCIFCKKTGGARLAPSTRRMLLTAIMKLVAQAGTCPPHAAKVVDEYSRSRDADLQTRCLEFQTVLTSAPQVLGEILPVDASCEDVMVDVNLSFLDGFVHDAVVNGAKEYEKPEDDDDDEAMYDSAKVGGSSAFKMTPYEKPTKPTAGAFGGNMRGMGSGGSGQANAGAAGVSLPPGGGANPYASTVSGPSASGGVDPTTGEPQLMLRNVKANVWSKGGVSSAQAPTPPAASAATATPVTGFGSSSAGYGSPAPAPSPWAAAQQPAAPVEPVKTAEQLARERQAAALFGGIISQPTPVPTPAPPAPSVPKAPVSAPAPAPVPVPAPPPAPLAPEVDLLDMSAWDAPASTAASAPSLDSDMLTPTPVGLNDGLVALEPEPILPQPEPAAPADTSTLAVDDNADPFSILDGGSDANTPASLPTLLATNSTFEYEGTKLAPLSITTAQFGPQWGSCTSTSPISVPSTKIDTLAKFMNLCESIGAHLVESIAATNEGICAGMIGGSKIVLIHGKISPTPGGGAKVDVMIKSGDSGLAGCLAMFLQNMIR
mmetsp:Transcript_3426/g.5283  ORF Transcript_3426/g.5283 Transcript_3426/m.5283 type:complete len:1070 (-) Transcript_3426:374-3583(-)